MNCNYLEYTQQLRGFDFYHKKSGNQIFKWQLYWSGINPTQVFEKYNKVKRVKTIEC